MYIGFRISQENSYWPVQVRKIIDEENTLNNTTNRPLRQIRLLGQQPFWEFIDILEDTKAHESVRFFKHFREGFTISLGFVLVMNESCHLYVLTKAYVNQKALIFSQRFCIFEKAYMRPERKLQEVI